MTQKSEEEDLFFKILEAKISKKVERSNNNKRIKNIFDNYSKFFSKRPKISLPCKAKDCELSVIQSHSISKKAVLKNISINGKVYTPLVEKSSIKMGKVFSKSKNFKLDEKKAIEALWAS